MIRSPFELGNFDFDWGTQANPAAAANLVLTVPVNCRSELLMLNILFTADANVSDRFLRLVASHGGRAVILGCNEYAITANEVRSILFGPFGFSSVADSGQVCVIGIPSYPVLLETDQVTVSLDGEQVGDQISGVEYVFKTWIYEQ